MVRISLQIIRNTDIPSVVLFCDQNRYFFNVPETLQRYYREHRFKMAQAPAFFFTKLNTENVSGLIGLMLTLFVEKFAIESKLYGPKGLCDLLNILRYNEVCGFKTLPFSAYEFPTQRKILGLIKLSMIEDILMRQNDCKLQEQLEATKKIRIAEDVNPAEQNDASRNIKNGCFEDAYMKIIPLQLDIQHEMQMEQKTGCSSLSYLIVSKEQPGKVLNEKIKEFNLQRNQIGQLIKQGSLIIDGREIKVDDIREKDIPPQGALLLDIEDISQLDNLMKNQHFNDLQQQISEKKCNLQVFIHLSKSTILQHHRYLQFFSDFCNYQHILANFADDQTNMNQEFLLISAQVSNALNNIFPRNFPKIQQHGIEKLPFQQKFIRGYAPLYEFVVSPQKQIGYNMILNFEMKQLTKEFAISQELKEKLNDYEHNTFKDPRKLIFLGTCSMKPGKYRNVSGVLLNDQQSDSFILMDSGEGTWKQIYDEQINIIDKNVIIWISHAHSDHHLGILTILNQITQRNKTQDVFLIIPFVMVPWIYYYQKITNVSFKVKIVGSHLFYSTNVNIKQILIDTFHHQRCRDGPAFDISEQEIDNYAAEISRNYEDLQQNILIKDFRVKRMKACPVEHCPQSYGLLVEYEDGKIVTYSGDTRPCKSFEQLSTSANIMIHEATFSDDLHENAVQNLHSTQREAVELGMKAEAEVIVLTHFSQRYAKSAGNVKVDEAKLLQKKEQNEFSDLEYQVALNDKTVHAFDHLGGCLDEYKQMNKVTQIAALLLPDDD